MLEHSPAERDLIVLVKGKLSMSWQYDLAAKMSNYIMGSVRHSIVNLLIEVVVPLSSALVWPHFKYCVQCWAQYKDINPDIYKLSWSWHSKLVRSQYELSVVEVFLLHLTSALSGSHVTWEVSISRSLSSLRYICFNKFRGEKQFLLYERYNNWKDMSHNLVSNKRSVLLSLLD